MTATTDATYTAAIGTTSSAVTGDHCAVMVFEDELIGYPEPTSSDVTDEDAVGYRLGRVAMDALDTTIRTNDNDKLAKVTGDADGILRANGWTRTADWTTDDNALYAPVKRN